MICGLAVRSARSFVEQKEAELHTTLLTISTAVQFVAASFAWRFGRRAERRGVWSFLTLALLLMGVRRLVALVGSIRAEDGSSGSLLSEFVALAISALMIVGVLRVGRDLPAALQALGAQSSLGQVLDNSLAEIYLFETSTLRFCYVNRGGRSNLGYSMEEMAGLSPIDLKPEFDEPTFRKMISLLLIGKRERIEFETVHQRKDGSTYPVQIDLQLSRYNDRPVVMAVVLDVTKRHEALSALRDSEEHFRTVIENSSDAVSVLDEDGTIAYESPAVGRILGYDVTENVGRTWNLIHPDDLDAVTEAVRQIFAEPDQRPHLTFRARHSDGSWRIIDAVASLRVLDGQRQAVVNHRDVTEQEATRRRQEEAEARLHRSQKLETIGTLAGGIAHDFNNLLTPILWSAELWNESGDEGTDGVRYAREVLSAAIRARELVRQILSFARDSDYEATAVDLSDIVSETIDLLTNTTPTSMNIEQRIEVGLTVLGNAAQLHQVVLNLCTNAQHAMGVDGTLSIELSTLAENEAHSLTTPHGVRLTVRDNGHGIDETFASRIFEPFFTTKSVDEGTGLGLAVVYGIVEDHGGTIEFESAAGEGATFTVLLPLLEELPSMLEHEVAVGLGDAARPNNRVGTTVLLVEDEPSIRSLLAETLRSNGWEVVTCSQGQEALETLRSEPHRFDLLLTDQTMPGVTGVELIESIQTTHADLPAVLMTGYSDTALVERLRKCDVRIVLAKPFQPDDLMRSVGDALDSKSIDKSQEQ